ncbi:MAG TPA: YggS family pyridoxal phosphate-dependent enzyme [Pirellulaceae bacterium]|nr:YggS family pyridoxal phosphate-dependent enzyme [Pirellulaceae bacterium]
MSDLLSTLAENLVRVRQRIADAAAAAGRQADEVTLIGVTKYAGPEVANLLVNAGLTDLGESRPQELWRKAEALAAESVRWHLVGHLQRNKIRRTLPLTTLIHSGDSLRLLAALNEDSVTLSQRCDVLLEVNISGDQAKHGFSPGELAPLLPTIAAMSNLHVRGLMGMASLEGSLDDARRQFASLRELRDDLRENCPPQIELAELSMGMSGDFEQAIAEGATMVRIGSALLEGVTA